MPTTARARRIIAPASKFQHPDFTAGGDPRAKVAMRALETLWFNTGTLCNLTCANCYIESSPRNDRLTRLSRSEVAGYLQEIAQRKLPTRLVGFTGGEPFMNDDLPGMLGDVLSQGLDALVLTNAMKPMRKMEAALLDLNARFPGRLTIRVSLDHYRPAVHEAERGARTWQTTVDGLVWLARNGFQVHVAARLLSGQPASEVREGFGRLFAELGIDIAADDPVRMMLFPEMGSTADVPEITTACWGILDKSPDSVMCASSRMVVKRRGASNPSVVACTLLPYDHRFELGTTLAEAAGEIPLNHRHCAEFCVLGGAACSAG